MSTVRLEPLLHSCKRDENPILFRHHQLKRSTKLSSFSSTVNYYKCPKLCSNFCKFKPHPRLCSIRASSTAETTVVEADTSGYVLSSDTIQLKFSQKVEGKISVRLNKRGDGGNYQLTVGCNLPGKWVLHWGVTYCDDFGREWDQPPPEMRPPGSIAIKDYAIETPLKKSPSVLEGHILHDVHIDINADSSIAAINFVLKEEEMGAWYQHRGRDFRVPLTDQAKEDGNTVGGNKSFSIWPGAFGKISSILLKSEGSRPTSEQNVGDTKESKQQNKHVEGFYEEYSFLKEERVQSFVTVSVRNSLEEDKTFVRFDTDLPGDVVVHWGVCRDGTKRWEVPPAPHPPKTRVFRNKALQTLLKSNKDGDGSWGLFALDRQVLGLVFVLKLNEYTWINDMGSDFYIPLTSKSSLPNQTSESENKHTFGSMTEQREELSFSGSTAEESQTVAHATYTDGIINEIRNLVSEISSEKNTKTKFKEAQENILQEIEKLAAEAYSIFRSSSPTFLEEEPVSEPDETLKPPVKICSGTGSGNEVLCQGFNWESHKSGRWYSELNDKATDLSSLGFTVIWLPPPTDSVSPEGYMPRDLYNLNSRYSGSMGY